MSKVQNVVLLDLDGTLVDSVFYHVLAWDTALREHGYTVPLWRIHASIGMGANRLIPWLLGRQVPEVDSLAKTHARVFRQYADQLTPTHGANALLEDLDVRQIPYLIATSTKAELREILLRVLGRDDLKTLDADDVPFSKPAADLLVRACETLGADPHRTTMVGDSPWDAEAAHRVGIRCLAVRCGGFGDDRLLAAGALTVVDDPRALVGRL